MRLLSSFLARIDGALIMVLAIDVALLALLVDGLRDETARRSILASTIVPMVLLAAGVVQSCRGLIPRHRDGTGQAGWRSAGNREAGATLPASAASQPTATPAEPQAEFRSKSQAFIRKWDALKGAALWTTCAVVWRFVAIRLN
jgi:hypothetical protein